MRRRQGRAPCPGGHETSQNGYTRDWFRSAQHLLLGSGGAAWRPRAPSSHLKYLFKQAQNFNLPVFLWRSALLISQWPELDASEADGPSHFSFQDIRVDPRTEEDYGEGLVVTEGDTCKLKEGRDGDEGERGTEIDTSNTERRYRERRLGSPSSRCRHTRPSIPAASLQLNGWLKSKLPEDSGNELFAANAVCVHAEIRQRHGERA